MIKCSVCNTENDDLAVICVSCKSYIQAKVDNINLFETIWRLIESPRSAFKRIVLSKHKNYVMLLSCILGLAIIYTIFWYKNLGRNFSNLATLVGTGALVGPPLGILFVVVFSLVLRRIARVIGGKATVKTTYAVVSYASVPIVLSFVLVFPLELALFGMYFFDNNPPPLVINPVGYVTLLGLDAVTVAWSWFLLIEGSIVANGFSRKQSVLIVLAVMLLTGGLAVGLRYV